MKIAIATVQVPFITGGAEIHADLLRKELVSRGHEAEIVTIPFKWYPAESLLECMLMGRMMDLTEVNGETIDLVIALKFPAYYAKHPNKIVWLLHQHRQAYELWGTPYGDIHLWGNAEQIRKTIIDHDNLYLKEAKRIFTNSQNTALRLRKYNHIEAQPLYHPPQDHERFRCDSFENFIFYPSRIDKMKRQRVLVEAARFLRSDTQIIIAGNGVATEIDHLRTLIDRYRLYDRVQLKGHISNRQKLDYYATCLGVYFGAYEEDYGYVTLEAFSARKPIIIHNDAGGPLEFVKHNSSGFIIPAGSPEAVAEKIDLWAFHKDRATAMGAAGYATLAAKGIHWDSIVDALVGISDRQGPAAGVHPQGILAHE